MSEAAEISEQSIPRLPRGVKLRFDKQRDTWVLLAPERVFVLDEISHQIVKRCDGEAALMAIVDDLAVAFTAPREVIAKDVHALLRDLSDKGAITL
jgi:pyrroloquinoline quinone biosynthesis protein D